MDKLGCDKLGAPHTNRVPHHAKSVVIHALTRETPHLTICTHFPNTIFERFNFFLSQF